MAGSNFFDSVDTIWSELTEIKKLQALFKAIGTLSVSRYDYNGFDARGIINHLRLCAKAKKLNQAAFFEDLINLVLIGLSRGNIRKDQLEKTVEGDGAKNIAELADRYQIYMKTGPNDVHNLKGSEPSFVRCINIFPHLASILIYNCPQLARDGLASSLMTNELPACMKHTGFAALIPCGVHDDIQRVFMFATIAYMIDFSKIINTRSRNSSIADLYNQQLAFCQTAMTNSMYSEDKRIGYLIAFELNVEENFDRVCAVAARLYLEVKKKVLDITRVKTNVMKDKLMVLGLSQEAHKTLIGEAAKLTDAVVIQDKEVVIHGSSKNAAQQHQIPPPSNTSIVDEP